ncbi:MAG: hypothetical protein HFH74_14530 [Lachnospiraceae bacterium]|nr:hypothetical protein [Lachnospiraceae bacterium]
MNASMRILIKIMLIILLKFFDTTEAPSNFTPQNKEISTTMLTEIATPLHTIGNTLFYGNLVIELPIGVTAEKKDATLDNQCATDVIDLKGAYDAPLPPRLWITHYRAQYTDEGKMIRALLERMPDTTLRLRYRDFDEKRYLFTYLSEDKMGYIINWMDIDERETLWKWTGNTLMKERACNAQMGGERVQICISDGSSDNEMFECNVALEEYREGSEKVQLFYKRFYENMVPAETFTNVHSIKYDRENIVYIPQEFLDFVVDAMLNGTEVKNLKPMLNDRELSEEEILSIAENNIDLRQTVIDKTWRNPYLMVMADGDNDGIPDIIARESYGGSDGSVAFVFYQGQEDGTFQQTDVFSAMREEFGIFSYKGKNYLPRTLFDYDKKIYNGLSITYYMEGKRVEEAVLMRVPKNYKTILTECAQEKYQSYAEQIAIKSLLYKIWLEEENSITGNSEQKLADYGMYQCDLNNDGVMDTYQKELWEPSNINICEYLYFDGDGEAIAPVKKMLDSLEGTPIMMWIDLVQDKNIINVISQTGLEDFTITGFLVQDFEYERLYEIRVDVTYAIDIWKEVS